MMMMEFKTWLWAKFDEWRKGTTRGVTEFAAFLKVGQPSLSGWLKGEYSPGSASLKKIAKVYPDVYEVFGEKSEEEIYADIPEPLASRFRSAIGEIKMLLRTGVVMPDSPEHLLAARAIFAKYGFDLEHVEVSEED